jgi:hypothetical protein
MQIQAGGLKLTSDTSGTLELQSAGNTKLTVNSSGATIPTISGTTSMSAITGLASINSGQIGGRRNVIHNPNGAVNQRHGTAANTTMNTYAMDRWRSFGGGTGYGQSFLTKSDAGEGDGYYIRYQRPNGNSTTFATGIAQGLETVDSKHLAGKTVTLSFRARGGANWSPTSGSTAFRVVGGEGTDQSPVGMTTAENAFTVTAEIPQGGGFVTYSGTGTIPADKTQIAIQIAWTWTGTAGANDYIDVRNLQLEIGSTATTFEQLSYGEELALCERYFQLVPQVGLAYAGATTTVDTCCPFRTTMRAAPTMSAIAAVTVTNVTAADFAQSSANITGSISVGASSAHLRLGNFSSLTTSDMYLCRNGDMNIAADAEL